MGVSFETCLRRREDVPMRRRCYVLSRRRHNIPIRYRRDVPLRRLGDVPSRGRWVFHLRRNCDVTGIYRETLLRRRHDVLLSGGKSLAIQKEPTEAFYKKAALRNFTKFTGKHLCQSLFFNVRCMLRPATLFEKRPAPAFTCEFCETFKNTSVRLLLAI